MARVITCGAAGRRGEPAHLAADRDAPDQWGWPVVVHRVEQVLALIAGTGAGDVHQPEPRGTHRGDAGQLSARSRAAPPGSGALCGASARRQRSPITTCRRRTRPTGRDTARALPVSALTEKWASRAQALWPAGLAKSSASLPPGPAWPRRTRSRQRQPSSRSPRWRLTACASARRGRGLPTARQRARRSGRSAAQPAVPSGRRTT